MKVGEVKRTSIMLDIFEQVSGWFHLNCRYVWLTNINAIKSNSTGYEAPKTDPFTDMADCIDVMACHIKICRL